MKKQTAIFFYLLGFYVVLQFSWWGYHLIELTQKIDIQNREVSKRVFMIFGEGSVFLLIVLLGLWKIRSSIKKEIKLTQQQNNFILSVTHELKTPLAGTQLYLQTLVKRDLPEEKKKELIEKAILENKRLELLIENLLNAASLEGKSYQPSKTTRNLSAFVFQHIQEMNKRLGSPIIDSDITPQIEFHFDELMFQTILNNLIDNAIKYSGKNQKVKVQLTAGNDGIEIQIIDRGPGIDLAHQKEIFKKFVRLENEETRSNKGSGLGLFICSEFIKLHQGTIQYIPNDPTGSIFKITLPND